MVSFKNLPSSGFGAVPAVWPHREGIPEIVMAGWEPARFNRCPKPWVRAAFTLILAVVFTSAGEQQMFPPGSLGSDVEWDRFRADQLSVCLRSFAENSLWQISRQQPSSEVYRLLWLRSFNPAICVRLDIAHDGTGVLTTKVLNGCCDWPPPPKGQRRKALRIHTVTKTVSKQQISTFLAKVEAIRFWRLPSRKDSLQGPDGATWLVEGSTTGRYQIIDAWSPPATDPINVLSRNMLFDLAELKLSPGEVY